MTSDRLESFTNGTLSFSVIDSGPLDGIPVVLLHGFPQRASSWARVSEHLHERGYRTYALDQRGYAPGARPRGRRAYRVSQLVGDALALISAIDAGPVHLVGHDWGATVAWATAAKHPERIRTLTTLSVPHAGAFLAAMLRSNQLFRIYYMGLFQIPFLPELFITRRAAAFDKLFMASGMTAEMVATFRAEIVADGALTGALNWYRALWMVAPGESRRKVSVPTTHVWSDGDTAVTRKSAELTYKFVTGPYELRVLEGVSHWIPDEVPAEVAQIIHERVIDERARSAG